MWKMSRGAGRRATGLVAIPHNVTQTLLSRPSGAGCEPAAVSLPRLLDAARIESTDVIVSTRGNASPRLYAFGDQTGVSTDEVASVAGPSAWGGPAGSGRHRVRGSAAAFRSTAACVDSAIDGIDHDHANLRPCIRTTPAGSGSPRANTTCPRPSSHRARAAADGETEAGARAGGAAPGHRWQRPVGLDQSGPPGRRSSAAAMEPLPG